MSRPASSIPHRIPSHSTHRHSSASDAFAEEVGLSDDDLLAGLEEDDDDGIPTYDASADGGGTVHMAGTERFGRWRSWVEKRSRERHLGIEDLDEDDDDEEPLPPHSDPLPPLRRTRPPSYFPNGLPSSPLPLASSSPTPSLTPPRTPFFPSRTPSPTTSATDLLPTHLSYLSLGPRSIPHSISPINCLLPIMQERYLLYGTMDGLFVISTGEEGGLERAVCKPLISGVEFVHLDIIHLESSPAIGGTTKTPKGLVIALVLVQSVNESGTSISETHQLRVYQLSSLASLARWVMMRPDSGVVEDPSVLERERKIMERTAGGAPGGEGERVVRRVGKGKEERHGKNRSSSGFSLRSLLSRSGSINDTSDTQSESSQRLSSITSPALRSSIPPPDDFAKRWAGDYKLLTDHERFLIVESKETILFIRVDAFLAGEGITLIGIITTQRILVYQSGILGDRSFKLLNALDLPFPPTEAGLISLACGPSERQGNPGMFVSFGERACLIRISDSQVTEVRVRDGMKKEKKGRKEMVEEVENTISNPSAVKEGAKVRSINAIRKVTRAKKQFGNRPPAEVSLFRNVSVATLSGTGEGFAAITKGRKVWIYPYPFPTPFSPKRSLTTLTFDLPPTQIHIRLSTPNLQLIGYGPGELIQLLEFSIPSTVTPAPSSRPTESPSSETERRANLSLGPESRFLVPGVRWLSPAPLGDRGSLGVYAAAKKGLNDWRVFWVGEAGGGVVEEEGSGEA